MRYLIGTLKVVFVLLAGGLALSLLACVATCLFSGESDKANFRLVMELSGCLVVSVGVSLTFKKIADGMAVSENRNKDQFLYYRDPSHMYKKVNGELK